MTTDEKNECDLVSREVALLLREIEKEPVPDRLLVLAQQLQKALNERQTPARTWLPADAP